MFLEKYLSNTKLELLYDVYEEEYLNTLDKHNFIEVYNVFSKYNFYFIDDIILNYLEIFELEPKHVENKILKFKNELGEKFVYIIGNNIKYLEKIFSPKF